MATDIRDYSVVAQSHLIRAEGLAEEASVLLGRAEPSSAELESDPRQALRRQAEGLSSLARTYAILAEAAARIAQW